MTRTRPLVAALLALPLLLAGCTGTSGADADGAGAYDFARLPVGPDGLFPQGQRQAAPVIEGTTLSGEQLDVSALRGQVVVLNFWADWCGPCRGEAPFLNAVATSTKDQGVAFVGINVKDDRNAARSFERVFEVTYPSIYDQPGVVLTRFRKVVPQTPPSTLLIDRQGRLAGIFNGPVVASELSPPVLALAAEAA